MSSQPIRVGFIGLSKTASWAVNAHLPYFKNTDKYRIVALLNSSSESAQAAISAHNLSPDTKAYGSPEKFAADKDIDLVVCSVRVDRHYPILKPILANTTAKAVHCEWPLGKNLAEAEELTSLAKNKGLKTIIGLQGRQAPTSHVVKNLIDTGKIGKPLSVTVTHNGYNFGAAELEDLAYLSDFSTGGNMVTIHFSHALDAINQAVGQIASYAVVLDTKREKTLLRNKPLGDESAKIVGEVKRTSHDQVAVQGHLQNGAVFSYAMRGGQPFPGTPALDWRVYGEKGEIRVTSPSPSLHFGGPDHTVQVHNHESNSVEDIELPKDVWDEKELPWPARAPARVYEAFADGKQDQYGSWEDAVKRHRLLDELFSTSRDGSSEKKVAYTS